MLLIQEMKIIFERSLVSTNDYLKLLSQERIEEFTVVYCEEQTKGKGQRGNNWHSSVGKNLTASVVLYPEYLAKNNFDLNIIFSVGISNVLKRYLDDVKIKWTNDIYVKGKKICGILIENILEGELIKKSIVGFGLNVNEEVFPPELKRATSIFLEKNIRFDISSILIEIVEEVRDIYYNFFSERDYYKNVYLERLFLRGVKNKFREGYEEFFGKIITVLDDGRLEILKDNGEYKRYFFKEVEYIH